MPVVAVIGASTDRRKFGNKAVRAFLHQGYTVVPVNPHEAEVEGLRAYPTVVDYPGEIDEATFYVPPEIGITLLKQVADKRIGRIWLNPGADGAAIEAAARALGIEAIAACSILAVGESPSLY